MKAEALILRTHGENIEDKVEAMKLINEIRTRSNLEIEVEATSEAVEPLDEEAMLQKSFTSVPLNWSARVKRGMISCVSVVVTTISTNRLSW